MGRPGIGMPELRRTRFIFKGDGLSPRQRTDDENVIAATNGSVAISRIKW